MDDESIRDVSTRLAEDRTILANERTYSAWIRTGLAALGGGVAFEVALANGKAGWAVSTIAIILIAFSACAFLLGIWHYTHLGLKLRRAEIRSLPIAVMVVVTAALCAASLLAFIALFLA